jgi:hypothetical protein
MARRVVLVLLLGVMAVPRAQSQSFGPPVAPQQLLVLLDRYGNPRFTLAVYMAEWQSQLPLQVQVEVTAPTLTKLARVNIRSGFSFSPLLEGEYSMGRHWSLGFWYNPVRGGRGHRRLVIERIPIDLRLEYDTDLVDPHLTYYAARGTSVQVGYYWERGTIRDRGSRRLPEQQYTRQSANVWLTQRLDVRWGRRLVTPFLSLGYHSSSSLHHAASVMTGVAVTFNEQLSLSGSVWWLDLANPATRVTAGLVYRL